MLARLALRPLPAAASPFPLPPLFYFFGSLTLLSPPVGATERLLVRLLTPTLSAKPTLVVMEALDRMYLQRGEERSRRALRR